MTRAHMRPVLVTGATGRVGRVVVARLLDAGVLAAWGATIGRPAFVTSTVSDIVGSPPRTFRQWVTDHAAAFS